MSRRMNWREPYRDRDPMRTNVAKEPLPRHLAPKSSWNATSAPDMTPEERLNVMIDEVANQMRRIETRLEAWRDPKMKVSDHVRATSIAALDERKAIGLHILARIDETLVEGETPGNARRVYLEVWSDHRALLAPL